MHCPNTVANHLLSSVRWRTVGTAVLGKNSFNIMPAMQHFDASFQQRLPISTIMKLISPHPIQLFQTVSQYEQNKTGLV